MINQALINPKSIVVVGGSNNIHKPGGKIIKNLLDGGFQNNLYVVNPKEDEVQGVQSYRSMASLPEVDLAILAIAAKYTFETVKDLSELKNTKAFIIISAGFSEENEEGKLLENKIVEQISCTGGCLIGPNCTGIITPNHQSIFTLPIPELDKRGCDFISGSGATACFIMETGIQKGLKFAHVFSVGNSAQIGVEDVLEYLDVNYVHNESAPVKLLYIENIKNPDKILKHARSLIEKGCRIAAVKAGSSEEGSRAASSHTGALAGSDAAVEVLFNKAGIVRCFSRQELIDVASVMMYPPLKGKNIAIITHAGGPAVMLTDALSKGGLKIPKIEGEYAQKLSEELFPGSSVSNPIDFLATGTAEQLGIIIDYVNEYFHHIDVMVVIFGTPGLFPIFDVYDVLIKKMKTSSKNIYPVLPSTFTAKAEIQHFVENGTVFFSDEVQLANALTRIINTPHFSDLRQENQSKREAYLRCIENEKDGYLSPEKVSGLLEIAGIPQIQEVIVKTKEDALLAAENMSFPIVMKVIGPVHKTDVGGISLNIKTPEKAGEEFERLIKIQDTYAVLMQNMVQGTELYVGAKAEKPYGHLIFCGMGGILIEAIKDVKSVLTPVNKSEALWAVNQLKSQKILEGTRGKAGVSKEKLAEIMCKLSDMLAGLPEIQELDFNPIMGENEDLKVVDARIRIEKNG